jgi:hypothetical protein
MEKETSFKKHLPSLDDYKFDTSSYVILDSSVRRDIKTGCLEKLTTNNLKSN